jgi:hypothetical protein
MCNASQLRKIGHINFWSDNIVKDAMFAPVYFNVVLSSLHDCSLPYVIPGPYANKLLAVLMLLLPAQDDVASKSLAFFKTTDQYTPDDIAVCWSFIGIDRNKLMPHGLNFTSLRQTEIVKEWMTRSIMACDIMQHRRKKTHPPAKQLNDNRSSTPTGGSLLHAVSLKWQTTVKECQANALCFENCSAFVRCLLIESPITSANDSRQKD